MGVENNNLDLSKIDNDDLVGLAQNIEQFYSNDAGVKSQLSYHWERNHLMLDGKQWLQFNASTSANGALWAPLNVMKQNEYIPRPVTNYIFDCYQTLKSYLIKDQPKTTVTPNTQTHRDKSAAKLANLVNESNYERLKEIYNYEYAASCVITYGTVFKKDYWDSSTLMMAEVPKMVPQPEVDPMTGMPTGNITETQATDPETGQPMFDSIPLGDVNTDIVEPYRICLDPLATDLHKARWVMEYSIQPLDLVVELFDKEEPGYTGQVKELKPEKTLSGSMQRFYQLKNSSGTKGSGLAANGQSQPIENTVVLKEYYERPSAKYPKGRMICVANGLTLFADASPYEGPELGDWHPYSECRWEVVPGRFWGKSPLDDTCELQKKLNSIDSVIILTRKTMAIPQKLIPTGSSVAAGSWGGKPGAEIFYRADPSGAKPETVMASGVHESVFQERSQVLEDIKQISGAIDILKGDRPPGVTAASALNMLYEVGTGKIYPVLRRWKCFVESSQKKQLKLVATRYQEPREDFIKLLRAKNTELSPEEINKFIGADLHDNFNVVMEPGSSIPKLQAAKQAALQEAAQTGALALENPINRAEYQRQMGITGFDNDIGKDQKRAEWENDILDDTDLSPDNKPIVLAVDNDDVHEKVHGDRMKEPSFFSLSANAQQAYMRHIQEHQMAKSQKMQAQMLQMMAMGQDPAAGGRGGASPSAGPHDVAKGEAPGPKSAPQELGRGPTKEVKNSLKQDAMVPGAIGGA